MSMYGLYVYVCYWLRDVTQLCVSLLTRAVEASWSLILVMKRRDSE